jgi:hypothetical protein
MQFVPFGTGVRCRESGGLFWNKAPRRPRKNQYRKNQFPESYFYTAYHVYYVKQ